MKTLHLNLIKKWYSMTFSGVKKEEYREITPYWCARFILVEGVKMKKKWWDQKFKAEKNPKIKISKWVKESIELGAMTTVQYDTTTFSNGYSRNRPQFEIEFKGIEVKTGCEEWGAKKDKLYFVIKHGKVLC